MKWNLYTLIAVLVVSFSACTKIEGNSSVEDLSENLIIEPAIPAVHDPGFPQPVTKQAFYFMHNLDGTEIKKEVDAAFGKIHVSYQLLNTLKDNAVKDYLNSFIEKKIDELVDDGIPKYPGILSELTSNLIEEMTIDAYMNAANNIVSIQFSTRVSLSNHKSINSTKLYNFDLLTGQKITINNIMNSNKGLADLNNMVLTSMDSFVDPADVEDHASLYEAPFQQSFRGLPEYVSIYLYPASPFQIVLNETCVTCYFPWLYGHHLYPHWISLQPTSIYDRYYQDQLEDYASDGEFYMDFGKHYYTPPMFSPDEEIISTSKAIKLFVNEPAKSDTFYFEQKKSLITTLLDQLAEIEQITDWKPSHQDALYLNYVHNEKIRTIEINYYLATGSNHTSGVLIRNFRNDTKEPLLLADVFDSQFDYKQFLEANLQAHLLEKENIAMDYAMIRQKLDSISFAIGSNGIHLYLPIIDETQRTMSIVEYTASYKDIGIDHLSAYLKQAPKEN